MICGKIPVPCGLRVRFCLKCLVLKILEARILKTKNLPRSLQGVAAMHPSKRGVHKFRTTRELRVGFFERAAALPGTFVSSAKVGGRHPEMIVRFERLFIRNLVEEILALGGVGFVVTGLGGSR